MVDGDDSGGVMVVVLVGLCGYRTVGFAGLAYACCLCFLVGLAVLALVLILLGGVFECCFCSGRGVFAGRSARARTRSK